MNEIEGKKYENRSMRIGSWGMNESQLTQVEQSFEGQGKRQERYKPALWRGQVKTPCESMIVAMVQVAYRLIVLRLVSPTLVIPLPCRQATAGHTHNQITNWNNRLQRVGSPTVPTSKHFELATFIIRVAHNIHNLQL
jgi:hypothetical protein